MLSIYSYKDGVIIKVLNEPSIVICETEEGLYFLEVL